jgi:hypothetical protein
VKNGGGWRHRQLGGMIEADFARVLISIEADL